MSKIAIKRAKFYPEMEESLHPEFITEYADTSMFPEGFHKAEDGYEFLTKKRFDKELAKNESRHQEFLAEKQRKYREYLAAQEAAQSNGEANE